MKLSELETQLNKQKARIGLTGGRLKLREQSDATEPVSAQNRYKSYGKQVRP